MSATEAKYNLHAAHEVSKDGGVAAILADMRCLAVPVLGGAPLFPDVPNTPDASKYCRSAPAERIRSLSGTLATRENYGRRFGASLIAGTCKESVYGNQAVYSLAYLLLSRKTGLSIQPSAAFKHAEKAEATYFSFGCHASQLNPANCAPSFAAAQGARQDHLGEHAADYITSIYTQGNSHSHKRKQQKFNLQFQKPAVRKHCLASATTEELLTTKFRVGKAETSLIDIGHQHLDKLQVSNTSAKDVDGSDTYSRTYVSGNALYWVCRPRKDAADPPKGIKAIPSLGSTTGANALDATYRHLGALGRAVKLNRKKERRTSSKHTRNRLDAGLKGRSHTSGGRCHVLFERDRADLVYLLNSYDAFLCHRRVRLLDIVNSDTRELVSEVTGRIAQKWVEVIKRAGSSVFLASNVGTLLDQVVWIVLADLAGSKYFDHAKHMRKKAMSKVPGHTDLVTDLVSLYSQLPVDLRIDFLGINKMSVYPQVCAYDTVTSQLEYHSTPHDCKFDSGSPTDLRRRLERDELFIYMRYYYIRIFQTSFGYAPGKIRDGAETKPWHKDYRVKGVPSADWRESTDVDLSNTMPIPKPDFDSYLTLADRSCAPSDKACYKSFAAYSSAPSYEKRKLLYFLQHPVVPDVAAAHDVFVEVGRTIPDGHVGYVEVPVSFSTDISTGTRFERQKPSARPFYQLCTVFGCLVSNHEMAVRFWLKKVPQSLMSMSLRDRGLSAIRINDPDVDYRSRFMVSDDKEKYSPRMDGESQAGTAAFFAEVSGDPSYKSVTNVLLCNELYYRVHGRLVHYPSNGTDREGLRGAQNTWLEIVCHGYHTRKLREAGTYDGVTAFIGFIDDALRRYHKEIDDSTITADRVREIVRDLEEKLRIVGRKLSWDKAYVSETLSTILGEIFFTGLPMANGLKSFVTFNDTEMKVVEDASSLEGNFASKAIGAKVAGANEAACIYMYIHQTMKSHHRLGVRVGPLMNVYEYCVWCMTPISFGGAGMRTPIELDNSESGSRTTAGIGNLSRLAAAEPELIEPLNNLLNGELEEVSDLDFLRNPTQIHLTGPRIRTQRVTQYVRSNLKVYATSPPMKAILEEADTTLPRLERYAKEMRRFVAVDVEEVKRYYAGSASSKLDSLVTKICSSDTVKSLLDISSIKRLRKTVRTDVVSCAKAFRYRLLAEAIPSNI